MEEYQRFVLPTEALVETLVNFTRLSERLRDLNQCAALIISFKTKYSPYNIISVTNQSVR